jgi:large subunit ribosomal protein L7/L12
LEEINKMDRSEIVEALKAMPLIEVADLVKDIEEAFGVSAAAAAPMMAAAPAAAEAAAEEKDTFDVELVSAGGSKINVIKAVREVISGLGLKEAKELVDAAPKVIKEGASAAEAEEMKAKLTDAGATVELK